MSLERGKILDQIADNLAFLARSVEVKNMIGMLDDNRLAQDFFASLFQHVYGYSQMKDLDRALSGSSAHEAIDLGDTDAGVAIQVTSSTGRKKIEDTIEIFKKNRLYKKYRHLRFLFIGAPRKNYTKAFEVDDLFTFDWKEDVIDMNLLIRHINALDLEELKAVSELMENHLAPFKYPDRLRDEDIRDCISFLHKNVKDLIDIDDHKLALVIPQRDDNYITRKNELNHVSYDFFKEKIVGHLEYNKPIIAFLTDSINHQSQKDYLETARAIQRHYTENIQSFKSFEDFFASLFSNLFRLEYDDDISLSKVRIVLHNMYFNCDIGTNPS